MNTQHLREFLLFAQEPNYSLAAERLYITRPTLVEHIRALESELQCKLVASDRRQVCLTPAGKRFVQEASQLLRRWEEIQDEYRELADNLLTVTISSSNLPWLETILYRARRAIHDRYPYKRIDILSDNGASSSAEALDERSNDIVVAGYKSYLGESERPSIPDGLCGFPLVTEEIKLLMTRENPLFSQPVVHTRDIDGATFVLPPDIYRSWTRDGVVAYLAGNGARVTLRTADFSDHAEYFAFDFGKALGVVPVTLVPRYGIDAREEYRAFSLDDLPLTTDFFALAKRDFVETENGGILFEEMRRAAAALRA